MFGNICFQFLDFFRYYSVVIILSLYRLTCGNYVVFFTLINDNIKTQYLYIFALIHVLILHISSLSSCKISMSTDYIRHLSVQSHEFYLYRNFSFSWSISHQLLQFHNTNWIFLIVYEKNIDGIFLIFHY